MPTQIDAFNPEFTKFGQLYKAVDEGSTQPTQENRKPPFDALAIPEDAEARKALNARLLDLFIASSGTNFNPEQLAGLRASLERAMPDPEKYPDQFVDFVRGRCHGAVEMLRLMVAYQNKTTNKTEVLTEADKLGADHVVDGMPEPLNGLDFSLRDGVLHQRVERVSLLRKTLQIKESNATLYPVVAKKYSSFKSAFEAVVGAYRDNIGKVTADMSVPEFSKAQWWNTLLNNLNVCDTSKPEEVTARLNHLADGLRSASDANSFMATINNISDPV